MAYQKRDRQDEEFVSPAVSTTVFTIVEPQNKFLVVNPKSVCSILVRFTPLSIARYRSFLSIRAEELDRSISSELGFDTKIPLLGYGGRAKIQCNKNELPFSKTLKDEKGNLYHLLTFSNAGNRSGYVRLSEVHGIGAPNIFVIKAKATFEVKVTLRKSLTNSVMDVRWGDDIMRVLASEIRARRKGMNATGLTSSPSPGTTDSSAISVRSRNKDLVWELDNTIFRDQQYRDEFDRDNYFDEEIYETQEKVFSIKIQRKSKDEAKERVKDWTLKPNKLIIPDLKSCGAFYIRNRGTQPLKISCMSRNTWMYCAPETLAIGCGKSQKVTILLQFDNKENSHQRMAGSIDVKDTNSGIARSVSVTYSPQILVKKVEHKRGFQFREESLDFGNTDINSHICFNACLINRTKTDMKIKIRVETENCNSRGDQVFYVRQGHRSFTLRQASYSLLPIRFGPKMGRSYVGKVIAETELGGFSSLIHLKGTGKSS